MAAGLLVLVCAAAVLYSTEAQDPYDGLSAGFKKGVDLALEQLSSHTAVQHHFRFWKSLDKLDTEASFGVTFMYHHFHLKPTKCPRGTAVSNPQKCPFRNDRPLMDCAICYKIAGEQIETVPNPYVHCIQRPRLTQEMRSTRGDHCRKMNYNSGAPTLLAVSSG